MADVARIWNLQALGLGRGDETERMAANVHAGNGLRDSRHVAVHAFAACAASLVMRVLFD